MPELTTTTTGAGVDAKDITTVQHVPKRTRVVSGWQAAGCIGVVVIFGGVVAVATVSTIATQPAAPSPPPPPSGPAVHFGFPYCYTSFTDFDTAWTNDPPVAQDRSGTFNQGSELRPTSGHQLFPYQTFNASHCESTAAPLTALGPHFVGLGLTEYRPSSAVHAFPSSYVGKLLVTAHGSWNRVPWIGHRIDSFDVDTSSEPYRVVSRATFAPPMRVIGSGRPDTFLETDGRDTTTGDYIAIRPVDVRSSPVDGSLLFTADRDDFMRWKGSYQPPAEHHNAGGLYRIIYGDAVLPADASAAARTEAPVPYDMSETSLGGLIGGDARFHLERLAILPCARQLAVSEQSRLLYVSTLKEFCEHSNKELYGERELDKGAIWAVELDPATGRVARKARLVESLLDPQGVDVANGTLYIATSGRAAASEGRGNCVLRVPNVDELAYAALAGASGGGVGGGGGGGTLYYNDTRIEALNCAFTSIQPAGHSRGHAWRSLRVEPSGRYAYVNVGSDCNWQPDCIPTRTNHHTDLLAFDVATGGVSVVGHGIRNAVGMFFDPRGNMLWIDNGSDDEEGLPGAPPGGTGLHSNQPDGELNVLYKSAISWLFA